MDLISAMTLGCIVLLVVFDYTNGFHDTANMVAASVATQAMTPAQAIALVSVFTFLGPVLGGTAVAETVGQFVLLDGYRPAAGIAIVLAGVVVVLAVTIRFGVGFWLGYFDDLLLVA